MFHKKKFTLIEQKNEKKMYSARPNVKWLNYVVLVALIGFVLLMILGKFKSKSYYRNLHASSKALDAKGSVTRSILSLNEISSRAVSCTYSAMLCSVKCSGDMTDLSAYLNNITCQSISLTITDSTFPDDRLKSDWLKGGYNIKDISITRATLTGIDSGAFDQPTVAGMTKLKLDRVQLGILTVNTFIGLEAVDTFTLVNEVEVFSGDGFLEPMAKKLKSLTIKHVTSTATDPTPWLRGGDFPELTQVVLSESNLGGYITLDTFKYLKQLQDLQLSYCKISYLPDGIFDFMMGQLEVYIYMDNNELKRLAGDYLTKVTNISRWYIHIEYNPWDCTCELEEFITEYTRYPAGFAYSASPAKCKTPSQHADKKLSEVVVSCSDDTTTALTTTLSTTTTDTTILSTLSSSTSEEPSTEPDTTPDSITSPVITTTNSSASPQTTPSPADKIVSIECKRYSVDSSESSGRFVELARPDTNFKITYLSETSALLVVEETADDLALIWFYDQPVIDGTGENVRIAGEFNVGCQSDLENSLLIKNLTRGLAYTFCLVKQGVQLISPFNCLSYYTSEGLYEREVWLKREDEGLVIGLFILAALISLLFGAVGMFLSLRVHPALLKCSNRVIMVNRSTEDVLIMPRPRGKSFVTNSSDRDSFKTNTTIRQSHSSETSFESGRSYMIGNYYEDIEYYRKTNVVKDMTDAICIPKCHPPPLPKRVSKETPTTH